MDMELKYGINAVRALEGEIGKTSREILTEGVNPADISFGTTLIWAGLLWKDSTLTVDQVGEELDKEEGLYLEAVTKAMRLFGASFKRILGRQFFDAADPAEEDESEKN